MSDLPLGKRLEHPCGCVTFDRDVVVWCEPHLLGRSLDDVRAAVDRAAFPGAADMLAGAVLSRVAPRDGPVEVVVNDRSVALLEPEAVDLVAVGIFARGVFTLLGSVAPKVLASREPWPPAPVDAAADATSSARERRRARRRQRRKSA